MGYPTAEVAKRMAQPYNPPSRLGSADIATPRDVPPPARPFELVNKVGIDIAMRQVELLNQFESALIRLGGAWPQNGAELAGKADPVPDSALGGHHAINSMGENNCSRLAELVGRLNELV